MAKSINRKDQKLLDMTEEQFTTLITNIISSEQKRTRQIMCNAFDVYERNRLYLSLWGRIKYLFVNKI